MGYTNKLPLECYDAWKRGGKRHEDSLISFYFCDRIVNSTDNYKIKTENSFCPKTTLNTFSFPFHRTITFLIGHLHQTHYDRIKIGKKERK